MNIYKSNSPYNQSIISCHTLEGLQMTGLVESCKLLEKMKYEILLQQNMKLFKEVCEIFQNSLQEYGVMIGTIRSGSIVIF